MNESTPSTQRSFALQKAITNPARRPLEIYHLSHDLRGPLNSMLGFCELLLEGIEGPLNDVQHSDITAIYQSAQNLLYLVNTMVDLSKLEANRLTFNFGVVQLDKVLQDIVDAGFGAIKSEHVEVKVDIAPALPPVWADRDRAEQIIKALLRFAFRLKRKGQFILAIAPGDNQTVTLQVDIDGIDLAEAEIEELFELVVRVVGPSEHSELGVGNLDLPLARYLVEKQQGRVWAESRENQGITLYLSFPRHETTA